jgi:hypothetical protein
METIQVIDEKMFEMGGKKYYCSYHYEGLGFQRFDTVEVFCSENHTDYVADYSISIKGFFFGFESAIFELGPGIKGFKGLTMFSEKCKEQGFIQCNCGGVHKDHKYIKVVSTRMVLIEKTMFKDAYRSV